MLIINNLIFLIIVTTLNFHHCIENDDDEMASNAPSFRIVAPKFLCADKKNDEFVPAPNEITITTQTRGGQKLTYRVQIYFVVLGKLKGQQHTLTIWKNVRQLQQKIATDKDEISLKNQITVHNSQLTPGVQYTFEIIGVDEAGRESKSQNFTIVYREGDKFGKEIVQDGTSLTEEVSLLLIGSEMAYGDMPIIIEARSIWCTPNNDYYMKWSIKPADNRNDLLKYFNIRGKLLRIPSGVLRANQVYQISVQILRNSDEQFITKAEMRLTIMSREYAARILPEILMVGINKEIDINILLRDPDNSGDKFNVDWTCQSEDGSVCEDFTPSNNDVQKIQFFSKGDYTINAVVQLSGIPKTLSSKIIINPEIIAYPSIQNLPTRAISVNDNFELNAVIYDLVPNCFAEWIVMKEDSFSYFNETSIPDGLGNITIYDAEETILSELVDYGNDTITRSIPLKIPKKNLNWQPEWPGLQSNSKYKFRLRIFCPEPLDDSKSGSRKYVESFTDVVIETNEPPVPQPMDVEPLTGDSLRTIFKFTTGVAKDRSTDYPLKYTFFYIIEDFVINLGEFYETMVTTTDLPYSSNGIQTYFVVCDARDACSNKVAGPNITINLVDNVTDVELEYKKNFIKQNMETMNLESSFNTAIACLLTYQHFDDKKLFNEIQMTIIEAIKATIAKIKNQEVFIYSNDEILYFIKLSKKILDVINYQPKDIYKGLLELLDNIDEYSVTGDLASTMSRMVDLRSDIRQRVKRSGANFANQHVNQRDRIRDKIITTLDLYGKVFDDDELFDFVKRIEQEIRNFCRDIKDQKPLVYAKDYIAFEVIKTYDPTMFQNQALTIPFDAYASPKSKFTFTKKIQFPLDENYCYAKIFYPKRNNLNLEDNDDIFEFLLFHSGDKKYGTVNGKSDKNFLYEIPIQKRGDAEFRCAIRIDVTAEWNLNDCETTATSERVLKCRCLNFGLFKAVQIDPLEITSIPSKTTITTMFTPTLQIITTTEQDNTTTQIATTTTDNSNIIPSESESDINDIAELEKIVTSSTTTPVSTITTMEFENGTEVFTLPTTTDAITLTTMKFENGTEVITLSTTTDATTTTTTLPETTTFLNTADNINETTLADSKTTSLPTTSTATSVNTGSTISYPIAGGTESISTETTSNANSINKTTLESTTISEGIALISTTATNYPTTIIENVEIINQTATAVSVNSEYTTVVLKQNNNLEIKQTTDEKPVNKTDDNKLIINATTVEADGSDPNTIASIGISSALSIVIFCGFFGLIFGVLYNKQKRKSISVQEIEISTSNIRQPSQGIRYARFYDATNMGGSSHLDDNPIS